MSIEAPSSLCAVTGVGILSPAGPDGECMWQSLMRQDDWRGRWLKRSMTPYPVDQVIAISERVWTDLCAAANNANRTSALARFIIGAAIAESGLASMCRNLERFPPR